MSDQGSRDHRPGLRLDDARVDVDFKRRRRMSHNEYDGYGYERSLLHRVVAGAATPDEPQCEQETAEHGLEPQERERVEQIEQPRAIGDLRRRPQLAVVERAPGRLAAGWEALGEGVSAGTSIRRLGAAVAVLVPLALIAVIIAGQLSAGSPRRAVRATAPAAHAPAVRAPVSAPQTSRSRRVTRTRRSSATAGRHRPSVPSRRRSPPASTAVQARYTPPANRSLPAPVAPSAPYQAPSPAPVQAAPRSQPSAPQSTSHPSSPHPWGPGGSLGPGHSPDS